MISLATTKSYHESETPVATGVRSVERLIGDVRHGCLTARDALCERMHPYVLRRAQRMIPPRLQAKVDPEDLAQEVLLEFCRGIDTLAGHQEAQVRGWLCRATINRGRDLLRRFGPGSKRDVKRETLLTMPRENLAGIAFAKRADCPVQQAILSEVWAIVRAEILRLPEDQRSALELYLAGEQSYADLARSLGRSREAARKLCSRARQRLRSELLARQISA